VKYNKNIFFITFFLSSANRSDPWMDFTRDSSKDVKSRKDVPFAVIKLKFNSKPLFIPKNRLILAENGTFSTENA